MKKQIGEYSGVLEAPYSAWVDQIQNLQARITEAADPAETGRNRITRIPIESEGRTILLAVKSFHTQWPIKDRIDRRLGTKAQRSWLAATTLRSHGVGTPGPVGFLEKWEGARLLESYYLSEYQENISSFRLELGRLRNEAAGTDEIMDLLGCVAEAVRNMHRAGVLHNDLGNQNIMLRRTGKQSWGDVQFLDLNRARCFSRLAPRQRARDLSRLSIPPAFMRSFVHVYVAPDRVPAGFERMEHFFRSLYAWHCATRWVRHPLRTIRRARST